jgi:4-hydroxyphenylacetate 3-monooxygenase
MPASSSAAGRHAYEPGLCEDVYVGALNGIKIGEHNASFIVPVGDPGATTVCAARSPRAIPTVSGSPASSLTSSTARCELDDVFIPWERVLLVEASPEPIATWLLWPHLYGWLAKAEFTLGLALALTDAMGLKEHDQTVEYLVDLIADVQTARSCLTAAERDPSYTVAGNCAPNHLHLLPGGLAIFKARQRMSELLRIIPGSSLVVAPSDSDLASRNCRRA